MAIVQLQFNTVQLNFSIQIGDAAYVSNIDSFGIASSYQNIGVIIGVNGDVVTVDTGVNPPPTQGQFFSFSKPIKVNESGLKGYYANVTFENRSEKYAELFAISSEAVISSK